MFFSSTFLYQFRATLQLQKRIAGAISDRPPSLELCILKNVLYCYFTPYASLPLTCIFLD